MGNLVFFYGFPPTFSSQLTKIYHRLRRYLTTGFNCDLAPIAANDEQLPMNNSLATEVYSKTMYILSFNSSSEDNFWRNFSAPPLDQLTERYFGICFFLKLFNTTETYEASFLLANIFNFTTLISKLEFATNIPKGTIFGTNYSV